MTKESPDNWTVQKLLDLCGDPSNPYWETAWREFIRRYKRYIYSVVLKRCSAFQFPGLQSKLSEIVNDIVAVVYCHLCENKCRAIQQFRERNNEKVLLAWLATICNYSATRYLRKEFILPTIESDIGDMHDILIACNAEVRWQIYEELVYLLRQNKKNKKRNLERDINIFNLYTFADFSGEQIKMLPCFQGLGERVVDLVVNRTREFLRKKVDKF
jgi:hypothetical protein